MKTNLSEPLYFTLTAYQDVSDQRFFYFSVLLCVYVFILAANLLLIAVICVDRNLHQPMYMFLCSLFVNQLYGSSALFPFLLVQLLSDVHVVSAPLCFLQIFCIYTYGGVEVLNLAVMSYDRYLAICLPLHYGRLMMCRRVFLLISAAWTVPCLAILVLVYLSARLQLCGKLIPKVYCGNYSIVKLSCSNTSINNIYGLVYTVVSIIVPLFLILYSYTRILQVCSSGSRQTRQKALSTCTPHLASIVNFCFSSFFQILQSRFDVERMPPGLEIFLSLYFLTCQPLLNPLIYGLKMNAIRDACKRFVRPGKPQTSP